MASALGADHVQAKEQCYELIGAFALEMLSIAAPHNGFHLETRSDQRAHNLTLNSRMTCWPLIVAKVSAYTPLSGVDI